MIAVLVSFWNVLLPVVPVTNIISVLNWFPDFQKVGWWTWLRMQCDAAVEKRLLPYPSDASCPTFFQSQLSRCFHISHSPEVSTKKDNSDKLQWKLDQKEQEIHGNKKHTEKSANWTHSLFFHPSSCTNDFTLSRRLRWLQYQELLQTAQKKHSKQYISRLVAP